MDATNEFSVAIDCFTPAATSLPGATSTLVAPLLLSIGPSEQENSSSKLLESIAALNTMLVEPRYLQQISAVTFFPCIYEVIY